MRAMLEVDEHHWWYRGRRRVIRAELDRLPLPRDARVLDAGCGSGRTLVELVDYGAEVSGIELNTDAAELARGRGVGEALNRHALSLADRLGARTVDLTSRPSRVAANASSKSRSVAPA